jgi:hypothetical protein
MACAEEEPDLYDPFLNWEWIEAEVERRQERQRREEEEKAREDEERRRRAVAHRRVMDSILEHDPKTGREVYTRYSFTDFSRFDIDEECKSSNIAGFMKSFSSLADCLLLILIYFSLMKPILLSKVTKTLFL